MAGFTGVTQTVIQQYGLFAVFVYMFLESALLLHFTPSEVVLPFAAVLLVHGPVGFLVFVVVATTGGTAGGVFAYYVFGRGGEYVLPRYGSHIHLSTDDIERGQGVFRRWGKVASSSVDCFPSYRRLSVFQLEYPRWRFVAFSSTRRRGPPSS